uniref:Protein AF1q-like n=1 Tax=Petromyzon marinus TaxID=7757 RepID=A0AAJ7UH37_PETMA|nr:protein AF1q-like [Petromyzon marinus]
MHEEALLLQFNSLHFWKLPLPEIGSDDLQTIGDPHQGTSPPPSPPPPVPPGRAPHPGVAPAESTPRIAASAPHDFGTATYWRRPLPTLDPAEMDRLMAGRGPGEARGGGRG